MPAHRLRRRYERLRGWLAALPDDQPEARLPLGEFAALVGELPRRAGTTAFWTSGSTPGNNWRALGFRARLDELDGRSVVFTRLPAGGRSAGVPRGATASRYAKLCALLASLPAGEHHVSLSFEEIEALIQRRLPAGAWRGFFWRYSQTARRHWQRHGFQAQPTYAGRARVTFTRLGPPKPPRTRYDT